VGPVFQEEPGLELVSSYCLEQKMNKVIRLSESTPVDQAVKTARKRKI